jgi:eukaryotic-like serine/threonine-protein kinase
MHTPSPIEAVFFAALERPTPEERAAYLAEACGDDADLRRRVERLLEAHPKVGDFLLQPAGAPAEAETPGSRIGPYKLLRPLGEGGMGTVWAAEQTEPVKRRVALKVIRAGLDTPAVLRRFEAERQALALMDHSHIAKVFDADTTEGGRPYFVMELVKGVPITRYCDELHLSLRERLALFVPVCQAIQHAHQKGIIHRDVKPTNVLVAVQDGRPVPKVIDFGVAKALYQRLTDRSLDTEVGAVIGTLEYMAPEQAELSALDIDTRADVYALGVLLYELLTGTTPLDRRRVQQAGFLEVLRRIREEEPPRPSTRLTEASGTLADVAAQRRTQPARLAKEVRGELDWIVMKCLDKDRTRRYETADGLARDLQRYLADEPVEACPPSAGYRLAKYLRRHGRAILVGGLTAFVSLACLVGGLTLGLLRATADRDRAEGAERLAGVRLAEETRQRLRAERAEHQAAAEAALAQAVSEFLQQDLLRQADSAEQVDGGFAADPHLTVREALRRAGERVDKRFRDRPLEEAAVRLAIGDAYRGLGEPQLAVPHLERALALRKARLGPDDPATWHAMHQLGVAYKHAGRLAEAIALHEEALRRVKAAPGVRPVELLRISNGLAVAYQSAGRIAECLALYEEARQLAQVKLGPDHGLTLTILHNLATAYLSADRPADAVALHEQVLKGEQARFGPDHPNTILSMHNLALAYDAAGRRSDGLRLLQEMLKLSRARLGDEHPNTLKGEINLGLIYLKDCRRAEALPPLEKGLRLAPAKLGPDHPHTRDALYGLAWLYDDEGMPDRAEALFTQFLESNRRVHGPGHPEVAGALAQLGRNLLRQRKYADAEPLLRESLAIRQEKVPDDWRTFNTQSLLGGALLGRQRYAEAEPLLRQGYEGMRRGETRIPADGKPRLAEALERVVQLYEAWGKPDEAARWRKELEAHRPPGTREGPGPGDSTAKVIPAPPPPW